METLAVVIKHLHVWLVLLSISGFAVRFVWSLKGSPNIRKQWVKIAPHIVDTLLLVTGISLMGLLHMSPLQVSWLGMKLFLVVVYIFLGYLALRSSAPKIARSLAGVLALLTAGIIIFLAVYKPILI